MPHPLDVVLTYHEQTKHHLHRYASALGYLDWANQPDPFRRYEGAPQIALARVEPTPEPSLDAVLRGEVAQTAAVDLMAISQLFYDSLALSAWKVLGDTRWSLRVNPSSGNLHPTEGYLVAGPIAGLTEQAGVSHYAPHEHALEQRRVLTQAQWTRLTSGLPAGCVLIGLTSILWRESWKYGERAFRYCQHDAGHAIGAFAIAAAALGWETRLLESLVDDDVAVLLGVDGQEGIEAEHADGLLAVYPRGAPFGDDAWRGYSLCPTTLAELRAVAPTGDRNTLSSEHHDWPVIGEVAQASRRTEPPPVSLWAHTDAPAALESREVAARPTIRQRRSAVAMDGETSLSREAFYRMLASLRPGAVPFTTLPWRPRIHLGLFVHRVEGVDPGLYCMVRDPNARAPLVAAMRQDFLWEERDGDIAGLGLNLLVPLDCRDAARTVSCQQDIAADGAFALGMLAEYEDGIVGLGPWFYRRLHWEAGALGQVLYLEAEAAGVRSTGIGCFFDDSMHGVLGIVDQSFQTLYHFTVGGAVDDDRLQTIGAYDHLERSP